MENRGKARKKVFFLLADAGSHRTIGGPTRFSPFRLYNLNIRMPAAPSSVFAPVFHLPRVTFPR